MISAIGLGMRYGEVRVFEGLCFRLGAGELLSVRGPNGSGKTTLARLCAGMLAPTEGLVRLDAGPGGPALRAASLLIGMPPALYEGLTLEQNLSLALAARGLRIDRGLAWEALARVDVACPGRRAGVASVGEQIRCLVAIARLASPRVLLLDEPAGCLDEAGRCLLDSLVASTLARGGCVIETSATGAPRGKLLRLGGETL